MRTFGTRGPVDPEKHYVVHRTDEIADFINRVKDGRYMVIFAPRQTGKTTFFYHALDALAIEDASYFPIQLDFEEYKNRSLPDFYDYLYEDIREAIEDVFQKRGSVPSEALTHFLENARMTDHVLMRRFFKNFANLLNNQRVVLIIDEFDGIPQTAVSDFLYSLRRIYISRTTPRSPYSLGIIGVKNITQLGYDRSISPFNIQDEFTLRNFTLDQVHELLTQYTEEVGQAFAPEVISAIHKQTGGQPFLVNRLGQILTEEMDIPKTETIGMTYFAKAHTELLEEGNTNIDHLLTNIRRDRRFETLLMKIASYDRGLSFNPDNAIMSELATYGVVKKGADGMCEIINPIYQHRILQTFKPTFNGLEDTYFPEDTDVDFADYLTAEGHIDLEPLLDNFQAFIARAGFRILQVPDTPQEYVGQHLLYAYLDHFVRVVGANMFLEIQTGRGRIDLLLIHGYQKYVVETKIWEGNKRYQAGKKQLAAYLKLEEVVEGYYVLFDHRRHPEPLVETETVDGVAIRSY
ncbi:MAG: AAA-like domain-containing protein, partial [Candidatus Poribacteria bacterium]|nr:AAA-like domain-containing protein [Candidatus Poribacteria bacterium]